MSTPTLVLSPIGFGSPYLTNHDQFICCEELQYRYFCDEHFEQMGCQFCEFNPYENCEEQH
jgi:hypothetical protein